MFSFGPTVGKPDRTGGNWRRAIVGQCLVQSGSGDCCLPAPREACLLSSTCGFEVAGRSHLRGLSLLATAGGAIDMGEPAGRVFCAKTTSVASIEDGDVLGQEEGGRGR